MIKKPVIAVTMGDPAGVGPEICLRVLSCREVLDSCTLVVFGHAGVLRRCAELLGLELTAAVVSNREPFVVAEGEGAAVVDIPTLDANALVPGQIDSQTGRASYEYVQRAIEAALRREVSAVVTAPLSKEALSRAGIDYPGHTEIFALRTAASRWCMLQYAETIACSFVTVHVGYAEVPEFLTADRVLEVVRLSAEGLERIRKKNPRIVVCGLNPHAGENGLFGEGEEERVIAPAVAAARQEGLDVVGPLPADTAFLEERRRNTDVFVCMYHDQGHIPVKALAFDTAVNVTLGLPIVRTSVDHGTALDIAWQGKARSSSLRNAVALAIKLSD